MRTTAKLGGMTMGKLDEILQEIEEMKYPIDGIGCGLEDAGITDRYEAAEYGWNEAADMAYDVVKNHLSDTENEGWILVEDGLPEERNSMFAKWKGTDKWSESMFEKISSDVNVTVEYEDGTRQTITAHTLDGKWALPNRVVKQKVIAWRPLPEPYNPEKGCD